MKALAKEPEKTVSVWKCENPNGGIFLYLDLTVFSSNFSIASRIRSKSRQITILNNPSAFVFSFVTYLFSAAKHFRYQPDAQTKAIYKTLAFAQTTLLRQSVLELFQSFRFLLIQSGFERGVMPDYQFV